MVDLVAGADTYCTCTWLNIEYIHDQLLVTARATVNAVVMALDDFNRSQDYPQKERLAKHTAHRSRAACVKVKVSQVHSQ